MTKSLRQVRADFSKKHKVSSKIIRLITQGKNTTVIAEKLQISVGTVRTTRGNLTRGMYLPFVQVVDGKITGICKY